MRLDQFSYLIKVPLALCVVSVASAFGIFMVTYYLLASYIGAESMTRVQQISSTLATSARGAIGREEIWDIYQQINAAVAQDSSTEIVVISKDNIPLVASDPIKYPVSGSRDHLPSSLLLLSEQARREGLSHRIFSLGGHDDEMVYGAATMAVSEDGDPLATVVVYSRKDATLPKLRDLLFRVLGYGTLALAFVIPFGWWLGRKLVSPLNRLRTAMATIEENDSLSRNSMKLDGAGTDEISQLTKQFISMHAELHRSRDLEMQMQIAERMAMAGKLASSLAHEVNNPLGGMLNAISNLRLRGISDPFVEKTANLLERGLQQIQDSISALMSQARREHTVLTWKDFDDLQTLSEPIALKRDIDVVWQIVDDQSELGLRSVPVRQIVLNLVLNAINAALVRVEVQVKVVERALFVRVKNDGGPFSATEESAPTPDQHGRIGLGLWVCFRLTRQIGGALKIEPTINGRGTVATFIAPLEASHD
ncbi:sensor histidine kinase [Herminiimonas arsenitoxidans]|uniref:sensor histidine kinase n=1 Tax=Herminiimonas arsenitoxidans TaxID=1809410 RepID=UPI000970D314|nr:HAMP domain-containing sensor histidine kinase [Herminiimonas arsenitoxidans]